MTSLDDAQRQAWQHQDRPAATTREALARLQETLRWAGQELDAGRPVTAQMHLEDALPQLLIAMRHWNLRPEAALERALRRLQTASAKQRFHIFADRVEIRVDGQWRGGWPLHTEADYQAAVRLARELGCDILHEEADQLEIFAHAPGASEQIHC